MYMYVCMSHYMYVVHVFITHVHMLRYLDGKDHHDILDARACNSTVHY